MTVDTPESVLVEFREVLNDISATHEAALWGLNLIRAQMTTNLAAAPDPRPTYFLERVHPTILARLHVGYGRSARYHGSLPRMVPWPNALGSNGP
jgi:hypothetical protein